MLTQAANHYAPHAAAHTHHHVGAAAAMGAYGNFGSVQHPATANFPNTGIYTHSPYGAPVMGAAAPPSNFTIVGRKSSGSDASSNSGSEQGMTPPATPQNNNAHRKPNNARKQRPAATRRFADLVGQFEQSARTAIGSTTIQQAINDDSTDPALLSEMYDELEPHFSSLLFDRNASYVVRLIIAKMSEEDAAFTIRSLCSDTEFMVALCTHSLHTRRIVQFFTEQLNQEDSKFLTAMLRDEVMFMRIAVTEQGCITIQRILDAASAVERESVLDVARTNIAELAKDAHGNYVIQYLLRTGELLKNSAAVIAGFCPRIIDIACDKFASNVLEKALETISSDAAERLVGEIYAVPQWQLQRLLNDGVGNYIVQATIQACTPQQLFLIRTQLTPLLSQVPYGGKIEAKIQQRAAVSRHA